MKRQTAIEWLVKELELEGYDHTIQIAKAMEKEQIEIAYLDGGVAATINKYVGQEEYYKSRYERTTSTDKIN